ncbi:MAG: NAD/NADP octopine/nopaline dehydrogenase family protein [Agathobacter sp.]
MNITIVGGGNIGTQFAVHCAEKGHCVTIHTTKPEKFDSKLSVVDETGKVMHEGTIHCATTDDRVAFENADVVFITLPAYCMNDIAKKMLPYVRKGMKIGLIPGTGGGECAFHQCIEKGAVAFGLQRVPSVARLVEYGRKVCAIGYRDELYVASIPSASVKECAEIIFHIFDKRCIEMPNYLNLTLTPSNPVLHTTRLRTLFKDYHEGVVYEEIPLFYEQWDNETSELLLKCDEEVQQICRALDMFELSFVKPLSVHYESDTPEKMTKKISSIQGFKGLTTPSVKVDGGYIPDLSSRYFTADFPYGLAILVQIADFAGVEANHLKETMNWYRALTCEKREFRFSDYGINSLEDLIDFYSK